jgi:hypothetical protein
MSRRLVIAPRFNRVLASMEAHYSTLLDHHPDAGSSLEDFVDALVIDIAPLLMSQPGILYAVAGDAIVLVSVRDQRQQDFS